MPNIRAVDMMLIDDVFEMGSGYVLDFNDRSFAQFFAQELSADIDHQMYRDFGTSKAKRLRCYLSKVDLPTCVKTLRALWEYREAGRLRRSREEWVAEAGQRFQSLLNRLDGRPDQAPQPAAAAKKVVDPSRIAAMKAKLIHLSTMEPQPRGYAFEVWLRELFDLYELEAREPFRNRGEQIDGSFLLRGETYLLEAKWQNPQVDAKELHAFHGKVEQKAAWARGLFISNSGFSDDGLIAFGRGKKVICMDGLDLFDMLERELPLDQALERKVRRAAETGLPFLRIRDLFSR